MATVAPLPRPVLVPRPRPLGLRRLLALALVPGAAGAAGAVPALPAARAQRRLVALGLLPERAATARWDVPTVDAVRRFQADRGLVVDGVAGAATADRLLVARPPEAVRRSMPRAPRRRG